MRTEQETEKKLGPRTMPSPDVKKDTLFVALGKDVKESETVLKWALRNSRGRMRICVLHVHQPAQKMAMMGSNVSISLMEESLVKAHLDIDRKEMQKTLDKYIRICEQAEVRAEKLYVEMDSIEKGIVKLISEHGIKWLVMGGAANKHYSGKMKEPKSKKALYLHKEAPNFCHIWFICKGNLIHTRESEIDGVNRETVPPPIQAEGVNGQGNYHRTQSVIHRSGLLTPNTEGDLYFSSLSVGSHFSTRSCSQIEDSKCIPSQATEVNGMGSELPVSSDAIEQNVNDELYAKFEKFVLEAKSSQESVRRQKAEKDAIDAIRKAKASETVNAEEVKRRRESEEAVARGYEEIEKMKMQVSDVMQELRAAQEHKSLLESKIFDSDKMVDDLEEKMFGAVELLKKYKSERDELQMKRDNAVMAVEGMRAEEASSSCVSRLFLEFCLSEIEEGTDKFSEELKVGEGSIYRGSIRHTEVAIKVVGCIEFQQEINILSKVRHRNIMSLIGGCPEACALIYEYLPNGSLEERLKCKDNTSPLPWKTRLCIASDLCSALVFLHSQAIIHGDLKPSNIMLDANFVTKLANFGNKDDPKNDVYSFGIILLRLLTGRSTTTEEVRNALDEGTLKDLLDPTAGDWPFVQAKQLAHLALTCADITHPVASLGCEVRRVLENMKISCGVLACFVCPIFQEIMQDPVAASDGFTYESEALKGWLETQDTSPMTNLKLPHCDFVPNHTLRSAIQDWLPA